jgi:ATP-dependent Clp protease ATP-binding subunit ClpX
VKEINLPNYITIKHYTPKELKAHLDEFIIGQDDAKKALSVAIYNHYNRILLSNADPETYMKKSNLLIAGPTGCGKTAMIKCLAEFIGVPYYIADATTLTQAGYVGDDVESILVGLLRNSGFSINAAEYGIVVIDEIDKIAKRSSSVNITRDVVGEGVQQALLKMIEGDVVGVPPSEGRKHPEQQLIYINTKNILFIGLGAFSGIESTIRSRLKVQKIGFDNEHNSEFDDDDKIFNYLSHEDLRKFGMIPEFIGRFPTVTNVNRLKKEDLLRILTEPKDSIINQYKYMLMLDNIKLVFDKDALEYIAEIAIDVGNGARSLRALLESVMNEIVYTYCNESNRKTTKKVVITKDYVKEKLSKRYLINK